MLRTQHIGHGEPRGCRQYDSRCQDSMAGIGRISSRWERAVRRVLLDAEADIWCGLRRRPLDGSQIRDLYMQRAVGAPAS